MSIVVISCVLFVSVKQSRKDSVMIGVVEWSKHSTLVWFWMKSKRDCRGDELAFCIYTMRSLAYTRLTSRLRCIVDGNSVYVFIHSSSRSVPGDESFKLRISKSLCRSACGISRSS